MLERALLWATRGVGSNAVALLISHGIWASPGPQVFSFFYICVCVTHKYQAFVKVLKIQEQMKQMKNPDLYGFMMEWGGGVGSDRP